MNDDALICDLSFPYRLVKPTTPDGQTLILLHGSGVDETGLVPFASGIAPQGTMLTVRGRVPQESGWRWYERITPTRFDQDSVVSEARAFANFVAEAADRHQIDMARAIFLGYSNGANLISSAMLLVPGLIRRAVLLRPMPVLDNPPDVALADVRVLVIAGASDLTYAPFAPSLASLMRERGATVDARTIQAGHELGAEDAAVLRRWIQETEPQSA